MKRRATPAGGKKNMKKSAKKFVSSGKISNLAVDNVILFTMDYKFIKVQIKSTSDVNNPTSVWLFEPQSEQQILEHWYKYACAVIGDGARILTKKIFNGTKGHCLNDFETAVETWMTSTGEGLFFSMACIEREALKSRLQSLREGRRIYLNHGMQVVTIDSRFTDIVNTIERDVLTFPDEDKPTMNDVRYIVWEGGEHIYAKIGKLDVVDDKGNQKWNTRAEAEAAARWYIDRNW